MHRIILFLALIMLPNLAEADCQSLENEFNQARDKAQLAAPTDPNQESLANAAREKAVAATNQGCNFTNQGNIPHIGTLNDVSIGAHQTPSSPGDKSTYTDSTYIKYYNFSQGTGGSTGGNSNNSNSNSNTNSVMPINSPTSFVPTLPATPFADAAAANAPKTTCGTVATAYGSYLTTLTGANQPTYKQGCSGSDAAGNAVASNDYPTTACQANQIGKFGLIQAAYSNKEQSYSTSNLISQTPATSSASNTVAFYNANTGAKNEPNGCRLTNYASCGQAGDIILVQSGTGGDASNYNNYLIYDGKGGFYYVQNAVPAVKHGGLPAEFANATYAATRPECISK